MKKFLILITLFLILLGGFFSFFNNNVLAASKLDKDLEKSVSELLKDYTPNKVVKTEKDDTTVNVGLKDLISTLVTNLSLLLGIAAIGAVAYGGITIIISAGEDEGVTKGKSIIKWAVLGFVGLVSASGLITLVINIMYGLAST
ncbi:MAG: pilin [Candidatus Gracilibacteria bacterium]|nr:pilin [Candidatus Gracilibacteria bacterium]